MSRTKAPQQRFLWGETRLLMDYLQASYPGRRWHTNIRVGPIEPHVPRDGLSDEERALMGTFRRYADAVIPLDGQLVVVETTMIRAVVKIGPLLEYLKLAPQTDEYPAWRSLRVRGELVSPIPDPRAEALCGEVGLRFVVFRVPWLDRYFEAYGRRFRTASLSNVRQGFVD